MIQKLLPSALLLTFFASFCSCKKEIQYVENEIVSITEKRDLQFGDVVDSLHGVKVYYNGSVGNVEGRNVSEDGYNIGLKYQCVEFVKRYYFEHYEHKMPNSYGHAKDFYNTQLADGAFNPDRNLVQYKNPSKTKPKVGDLLIFDGNIWNKYGHVAIVSKVEHNIEIIQQNPGPNASSRVNISLKNNHALWEIGNDEVLGWLRKE